MLTYQLRNRSYGSFAYMLLTVVMATSISQSGTTTHHAMRSLPSTVNQHDISALGVDQTTGAGERSLAKSERQKTLDRLLVNYDPRIPPNYEEDFPVQVQVQLHITSIDSISESNMDFSIGMFLDQTWNDSRLEFEKLPNLLALELDSRMMDKIWVPDLFISNEKRAVVHAVTVPNKLMHIYPEGRVQYSIRITATLKCNMDLRKFPLDSQTCNVIMESYGYSTDNLVFLWNPVPVIRDENLVIAQFDLGAMDTLTCDKIYVGVNYTCIKLQFALVRHSGYYLIQVYVPSIMIVILSWVSFWLDIEAVPARISLGLLTVLTMTTQSGGARADLPKVSYIKGIDVWMATCLIFVFAALIEFACVNVKSRVERRRRESSKGAMTSAQAGDKDNTEDMKLLQQRRTFKDQLRMFKTNRALARTIDRVSRIAFPGAFVVFNLVYWCVYVFWSPDPSDVA
ncbi:glycine receptor subunit alpha-3-like [Dreissena polymorpha]|nr:glycine receptor subunit alpha-3-like [Dreissena polymorpha]